MDHYAYVAQAYNVRPRRLLIQNDVDFSPQALGETTVNAFYPVDHTHTSPDGANVVAQAFVRGLLCSDSGLKSSVNSAGQAVPSRLLSTIASVIWLTDDRRWMPMRTLRTWWACAFDLTASGVVFDVQQSKYIRDLTQI